MKIGEIRSKKFYGNISIYWKLLALWKLWKKWLKR